MLAALDQGSSNTKPGARAVLELARMERQSRASKRPDLTSDTGRISSTHSGAATVPLLALSRALSRLPSDFPLARALPQPLRGAPSSPPATCQRTGSVPTRTTAGRGGAPVPGGVRPRACAAVGRAPPSSPPSGAFSPPSNPQRAASAVTRTTVQRLLWASHGRGPPRWGQSAPSRETETTRTPPWVGTAGRRARRAWHAGPRSCARTVCAVDIPIEL